MVLARPAFSRSCRAAIIRRPGKVIFQGQDITRLPLFERARIGIGRTYQTPLVPEDLTVGEAFKAARQAFKPWLTRFDAEYGANLVHFTVPYDAPRRVSRLSSGASCSCLAY